MKRPSYIGKEINHRMFAAKVTFPLLIKGFLLFLIFCALPIAELRGQEIPVKEVEAPMMDYDEIPIHVIVQGYSNFFVYAIYTNQKLLYVNVADLFKTLHIPCIASENGNSLSGFIENENRPYVIDFSTGQIKSGNKTVTVQKGLIKEVGALYLESSLFAEAFGLAMSFNYRTLTIILKPDFELPLIKQTRIESMRNNMSKVRGEQVADTIVKRDYHLLKFGMLDWLASSSQSWNRSTSNQFGLAVGTELLYGEAIVSVNYNDQQKFNNQQLQYLWRWVDNDKSIIKQAQVGKLSNQSISVLNAPVIGAVIRNSPTTVRKASGYYNINEYTEPNWNVELYINNVMVDFTHADASGLYTFKVPIVYGYTTLKFKYYGPLGEERTDERTMNVPYSVMPSGELEYSLSGGILQDSTSGRFGKGEINYGVNRILTIGGGMEYLSTITNGSYIPYLTATLQPFSKLTFYGTYAHGVKASGLVNYYFKKDILLEVDYTKYVEGQLATRFNAPEERKAKLSVPFRVKKLSGFGKFEYTQLSYKSYDFNQAIMMFSAYYKQFSANSSTQTNWIREGIPYITSDLMLSFRLGKGFTFRPSTQYNVNGALFLRHRFAIEKYLLNGNLSASYERNVLNNENMISVSLNYDLPFARANTSASRSGSQITTSQRIQGSLAFGGDNYVHKSNNSSVSKGGILLYPFLDLNRNGRFDKGEHLVNLTAVKIMSGKAIFSEKDSIIRIPDLNPFTSYLVELQDKDLENISWRFRKKIYQVLIDPNQFKRIDVPVISVGEVSGMVYMNTDNLLKGISRIQVKIYDKSRNKEIAKTLSESDGYLYYLGLNPGEYVARIDSEQLAELNMVSLPETIPINISQSYDGDIVSGLDFVLTPAKEMVPDDAKNSDIADSASVVTSPSDTFKITPLVPSTDKISIINYTGETFQIGAYLNKSYALIAQEKAMKRTNKPVVLIFENGFYKVCITGLSGDKEVGSLIAELSKDGYTQTYSRDLVSKQSRDIKSDNYPSNVVIQIASFVIKENATRTKQNINKVIDYPVSMIFKNGFYHVQIIGFTNRNEALELLSKLIDLGFSKAYIL